ncbi:hypothetical protein [Oceanidesulfovibrio marinus]|nr:hypothetical protein [Oceanidesulfovibrio marinus]
MSNEHDDTQSHCESPAAREERRSLSPQVQASIHAAVQKGIADGMKEHSRWLRETGYDLSTVLPQEALCEMGHLFGVFKDVGGKGGYSEGIEDLRAVMLGFKSAGKGDVHNGTEIFKRSMRILNTIQGFGGKVATTLFITIVSAACLGFLGAIGRGLYLLFINKTSGGQ